MGKSISLGNLQRYDEKIKGHIEEKLNQEHSNKSVLEKFTEDENGNLLYNGQKIDGGTSGDIEYVATKYGAKEW